MSKFDRNGWNTTLLTLNVMDRIARALALDIENDIIADGLYDICCDLESHPEDCGFGSSDTHGYIQAARREFNIPEDRA